MSELPAGLTVEPPVKGQLADDVTKISFSTKTFQNSNLKIVLNFDISTKNNCHALLIALIKLILA